jgi:hypothetical protein
MWFPSTTELLSEQVATKLVGASDYTMSGLAASETTDETLKSIASSQPTATQDAISILGKQLKTRVELAGGAPERAVRVRVRFARSGYLSAEPIILGVCARGNNVARGEGR